MTENPTWCPLPWMSLNVRNTGDIRVCCQANTSASQGLIKDQNGNNYNLSDSSIHDFRNAESMKQIRLDMLAGKWNDACIRCKRESESGMTSRRDWEKDIWKSEITEDKAKELTASDGSIDITKNPLLYMDLRFGNFCNLKCRMCGPTDSSMWYDDQVKVWDTESYNDGGYKVELVRNQKGQYQPKTDIYNWHQNPRFWEEMESEIPTIRRLYVVGGEPLMIDQHYEFLRKCIERGRADKILVEYNTNITNIPQRAWDIWKHFERIQIGFSVDGVGDVNEYIRYPSKWSYIDRNMRLLDKAEGNFRVWWAATIQAYNMLHLPDMLLWAIKQRFNRINDISHNNRPIMTLHPLHNPQFLNIKIFPERSKKIITDQFELRKAEARDVIFGMDGIDYDRKEIYHDAFCKYLNQYTAFMNSDDYSMQLPKFWRYTDRLDEIRNQSFRDMSPESYSLLKIT